MFQRLATAGRLSVAAGLAVIVLSGSGTPSPRNPSSWMATLEAGLPTLDEREACTTQCEYMICEPGEHFNAFDINLGGDGGEEHNCVFGPEGCAAHICGGEEEQAVVASIDALIGQLEGSEFEAVDQRFEKFYLNYTRGAIQILGCDNQVLLSRPLSDSQISELGGPGRLEIASLGR